MARTIATIAALLALAAPAYAEGPVFTRAGGIAAPGTTPAYSIDQNGNATFKTIAPATTVGGIAISTVAAQAAAALAASSLPSTGYVATYGSASRALQDRASDVINVMDYGAKGDGVTDDTTAFQAALDVATGNITGSTALTAAQKLVALAALDGIGQHPNHASEIRVPAGRYVLAGVLTPVMTTNTILTIRGASGAQATELLKTTMTDGIDITYATGGNGNDQAHSTGIYKGQAISLRGLRWVTSYQGSSTLNTNTAIKVVGVQLSLNNYPPQSDIQDVSCGTADGATGTGTEGFGTCIHLTDVPQINIRDTTAFSGITTGTAFLVDDDITAAEISPITVNSFGAINFMNVGAVGGGGFLTVGANSYDIQGLSVTGAYWLTQTTGIQWDAPLSSDNGSFTMENTSGSIFSGAKNVDLENIGTIISTGNFWYTANATDMVGHSYTNVTMSGVDFVSQIGDTIAQPAAAALGTGYTSIGEIIQGGQSLGYDRQPSMLGHVSISGGDIGLEAEGANVLPSNVVCDVVTTCLKDTYTGADVRLHPFWTDEIINDQVMVGDADQSASAEVLYEVLNHSFNGAVKIGLPPGTVMPDSSAPSAGVLDFRSLNADFDARFYLLSGSGSATSGGQGGIGLEAALGFTATVLNAQTVNATSVLNALTGNIEGLEVGIGPNAATVTGTLDFHYASDGLDYSARMLDCDTAAPTTYGTGTMCLYASGGFKLNGPLTVPSIVISGSVVSSGPLIDGSIKGFYAASGGTLPVPDGTSGVLIRGGAGTLATLTINPQANPADGQLCHILPGAVTVTALTMTPVASTAGVTPTIVGAPAGLSPTSPVTFRFYKTDAEWVRQ